MVRNSHSLRTAYHKSAVSLPKNREQRYMKVINNNNSQHSNKSELEAPKQNLIIHTSNLPLEAA